MLRLAIAALLPLGTIGTHDAAGAPTNGQSFFQGDHVLGLLSLQISYEYLLSQTVFAGFPDTASVAFYALPSVEPENGIWMAAHERGYLVVLARAKRNLWLWTGFGKFEGGEGLEVSGKIKAVHDAKLCEFREATLSKQLGRRVEMAWHRALFSINGGIRNSGLDGVTLIFRAYSSDRGRVSWDAWSPKPNSLAARMEKVALGLAHFSENGTTADLERALLALEKYQPDVSNSRPEPK